MHGPGAVISDQLVMMRLPRNEVAEKYMRIPGVLPHHVPR